MTATAEALLSTVLDRPEDDLIEFAVRLQDRAASVADDELSDEMKATLDRRWEEIESGKVTCIPFDEVINQALARRHATA
jgi:putative addiction module component (TIGR02574 family)